MLIAILTAMLVCHVHASDDGSEKPSPIDNIAFEHNGKSDECSVVVILRRKINPEKISIMVSETPDDENSYTVLKLLGDEEDFIDGGNRLRIPLDDDDLRQKGKTYSIQITEDGANYHSEAFQYDENEGKFKLKREMKSTGGATAGWIVALSLAGVALLLVLILICLRLCR